MPENESRDLYSTLKSEYSQAFGGWDFSYITKSGRMQEGLLTWNYPSIVIAALPKARSLLDVGTGGGELLSLLHPLPTVAYATEGYPPNVKAARRRLEPLGVKVVAAEEGGLLPFKSSVFDLVIDRHTGYSAKEVFRVLRNGGRFITQQVGSKTNRSLRRSLGIRDASPNIWNLKAAARELKDAGFLIDEQREEVTVTRFYDLGALVYYLKAIPWEVPNFSVEGYFEALQRLNQTVKRRGFIETQRHRCLIIAHRAAAQKV